MRTVNIFLAGAKDIIDERNAIKAIAHDFNTKLKHKIAGLNINVQSYENFNNNQLEYNDYIENESDIVIFLLKDKIGPITEKEFILAADAYNAKKIPEIMVFLQSNGDDSQAASQIRGLIKQHLDNIYYVPFEDSIDLTMKARERILNYLWPTISKKMKTLRRIASVLGLLSLLFLGLIGYNMWKNARQPEPTLLFAGGGSVVNYIHEVYNIDIEQEKNSMYSRMPSNHAWVFINEEANKKTSDTEKHGNLDFTPICLSADKATESDLVPTSIKDTFLKKYSVLSYYLGNDTLVLYLCNTIWNLEKSNFEFFNNDSNKLTTNDLDLIIKKYNKYLFTTRQGSGTLCYYQSNAMSKQNADSIEPWIKQGIVTVYNEKSDLTIFSTVNNNDNRLFAIMGSRYYYHRLLKDKKNDSNYDYKEFLIVNSNGNTLNKDMYLYFVGGEDPEDTRNILIPRNIYDFLKRLKPSVELKQSVPRENLIIPLNYK